MSSRLLLNLVRSLPAKSEFKTNAPPPFGRDGDWTVVEKMLASTRNELAAYRASKYAGTEFEYEYDVFISPKEARERAEEEAAEEEFHDAEFGKVLSLVVNRSGGGAVERQAPQAIPQTSPNNEEV